MKSNYHQTRANFVTYRTSTNNGDGYGDSNVDSDGDSDGDSDVDSHGSNEGDSVKQTRPEDQPGTLVNHGISTT